jgi:gamma-glutamyltranspeptidase/glutathione hydrolase
MLQQGGNAIDAAVATAAALNVVEPYMSGAGGVGYMVIRSATGRQRPVVLDYIGRAPAAATPEMFPDEETKNTGIRSPLVPGALGGWLMALERFGTMDRAAVFAPAIEYARGGFPVTIKNHEFMSNSLENVRKWATSSAAYLHDGETPLPGSILKQPDLARTFEAVVEGGAEPFYRGPIAREIAHFSQENGGLLTEEDLASYTPEWQEPISTTYRGYTVFCPPLPCSGMQYLQTLNIVEAFDMAGMGQNSADYIHHLSEAIKLAVADRTTYAPITTSRVDKLISKEYAAERRALLDPHKAAFSGGDRYTSTKEPDEIRPGSVESIMKESTTHFATADAAGNVVSCTQTLGGGFGSAVVHGNTGLALNNFANWFDLDPQSPNLIGPGKKVEMCLAPSQIWRDGEFAATVGTPGSFGIMQTTPQMIMNLLDHGFSIQAAIEAPRFKALRGTLLPVESRVDAEVLAELERRGHEVDVLEAWTPFFGGGQGILRDSDSGAFFAGADPRRDGYAMAH